MRSGPLAVAMLSAALLLLGSAAAPAALTVTYAAAAPTAGVVLSQDDFSGTLSGSHDYTNNGGPPGQSFTLTSSIVLSAVTFKISGMASPFTDSITLNLGIYDPVSGTYTSIDREQSATLSLAGINGDYLTLSLATPQSLAAGLTYAFFVNGNGSGWMGMATAEASVPGTPEQEALQLVGGANTSPAAGNSASVSVPLAGGAAYQHTFYLEEAVVPEPAPMLEFAVAGVALLLARLRFRRRGIAG